MTVQCQMPRLHVVANGSRQWSSSSRKSHTWQPPGSIGSSRTCHCPQHITPAMLVAHISSSTLGSSSPSTGQRRPMSSRRTHTGTHQPRSTALSRSTVSSCMTIPRPTTTIPSQMRPIQRRHTRTPGRILVAAAAPTMAPAAATSRIRTAPELDMLQRHRNRLRVPCEAYFFSHPFFPAAPALLLIEFG